MKWVCKVSGGERIGGGLCFSIYHGKGQRRGWEYEGWVGICSRCEVEVGCWEDMRCFEGNGSWGIINISWLFIIHLRMQSEEFSRGKEAIELLLR